MSTPRHFSTTAALVAIVVVSAAGLAQVLSAPATIVSDERRIASAILVALLCFATTVPVAILERRRDLTRIARVLWIAAAIAVALMGTSGGAAGLATLALVSESVLYLSRRQSALMIAAILAAYIFARSLNLPPGNAITGIVSFTSSIAFVVAFSRVAVREHDARAEVERLAAQLEELATTRERNRIAREIHDGLGHVLTAAHMQLEAARALGCGSSADHQIERVQALLRGGLDEVRRSVAVLRGREAGDQPLCSALTALAEEHKRSGLHIELTVEGAPRPLPPPVELALFRSAQEALTNTRRHASANRAIVALNYGGEKEVALSIKDDGVGADQQPGARAGFGLLGIRERVELVGGKMRVETERGRGFAVHVEVPA